MKVYGVVPARMAASRFPGKPLHPILGKTMLEHVFFRAKMFKGWDELVVATCDHEISDFAKAQGFPVVMTGDHHTRALDRVAEAAAKFDNPILDDDIIVCVQGDEPMMSPDMIDAVIAPMLRDSSIPCTVLSMDIEEESVWRNPDTVKIIHNDDGEVLYTTRSLAPYGKGVFSKELEAKRIYGIFAFKWKYLKAFTEHPETRLERLESCDSNRILDMEFRQYIAPYKYVRSYSVDSRKDIDLVEIHMKKDPLWGSY
jgi:3-deoxy-manno-octulosonate cytidylyltransferase (CMP-KDO synthetase)